MPSGEHADVVIVGGGAVGASTAYHLTELGIRDVVVIERDQLGSGSTGKAVGGVRLQFGDEVNIRTCRRAIAELERFPAMMAACGVDVDIELRRHGYLILLDSAEDLAHFRAALAVQHALGVPSRELTPAEAGAMVPQPRTARQTAGSCPRRSCAATPVRPPPAECVSVRGAP
jgi:sarcosine oxidase subunit beta